MGIFWGSSQKPDTVRKNTVGTKSKIENVDVIKIKLKQARDNIKKFIQKKEKDISQLDKKIQQQVPRYQETGQKKKLVPLLQAKKEVQTMVDNADTRLKLVLEKLSVVQLQQMDVQTVNVLDDSNKYIKGIQADLDKKDWRDVLDQARNKVQIDWGNNQDDIQEDQDFKALWKEIGGDKIAGKVPDKILEKKAIQVVVPVDVPIENKVCQEKNGDQKRELAMA